MLNGLKNQKKIVLLAVLTLASLLTYANSLQGGFSWDDVPLIMNNPVYKDLSNLPVLFKSSDTSFMGEETPYYRPLNNLSFMISYQLFGLNPAAYHAENVILHTITVLLLFVLVYRLFLNSFVAFLSALIFAVHPVNAEVVNLIVSRNNMLAAIFMFLSFITYLHALKTDRMKHFFYSGLLFFLGTLCKESALMLPLILLLFDIKYSRSFIKRIKLIIMHLSPFVLFTGSYFVMRAYALSEDVGAGSVLEGLGQRVILNLYVIPKYFSLLFFPIDLSIMYTVPVSFFHHKILLLMIWGTVIFTIFFLLRLKNPTINFGLIWFLVNFIPVSNIIPIAGTPMADRFMYLPAVGLCLVVAECFYYVYERLNWKKFVTSSIVAVILILFFLTVSRNMDWKDDISLFRSMIRVQPGHPGGHYNLGSAYFDSGDLLNAEKEWKRTIELNQKHEGALINLGNLYNLLNLPSKAKEYYYRVLDLKTPNSVVYYNLALTLEKLNEREEALRNYKLFLQTATPEFSHLIPKAKSRINILRESLSGS